MSYRRTPPLSPEGSREVLEEMANPPKDTPERRATEERVRLTQAVGERSGANEPLGLKPLPPFPMDADRED